MSEQPEQQSEQQPEQLIDAESRQHLVQKFKNELQNEVTLDIFVGEENEEFGDFVVQLCQELHTLDNRINPIVHRNGDDKAAEMDVTGTPTVLIGWDQGYRIRYRGAPVGHEAGAFIETIVLVSREESGLQKSSLEKLAAIDQDTTVQVFVTPTCPYCPRAVLLANQTAIAAKGKITAECVEASQNIELAQTFNVSSVPQQVINQDPETASIGAQPETQFVNQLLSQGASRYEEIMAEELARRAEAEKLVDDPTGPIMLTDNNFEEAVAKYPALVVDCWAEWCAPCRMVAPIIDELAQDHQGQVVFGKLDVDHNQGIAQKHSIMSIPTLLFFKEGHMVGSQVGALPKAGLEAKLKEYDMV